MKNAYTSFLTCGLLLGLAACGGPKGQVAVMPSDVRTAEPVYVATSRQPTDLTTLFGAGRSEELSFGRFDVSIPPNREPGTIKPAASVPADPSKEFFVSATQNFDGRSDFRSAINAAIRVHSPSERAVAVYVHGFDNTFADGLYRSAQMKHDFDIPAVNVHYSWPSAGKTKLYLYDRDSAFFARDGLEELLRLLAGSDARRIILSSHSMGTQVMVEAIRQMYIRGDTATFAKIHAFVLLSPDIDTDLFRREVSALPETSPPWIIFSSSQDKALRASTLIRGGSQRLGEVIDEADFAGLNVEIYDVSAVRTEDPMGHQSVASSPAMIAIIRGYEEHGNEMAKSELRSHGLLSSTVSGVQNATETILTPAN